jgi:hypothetical protein
MLVAPLILLTIQKLVDTIHANLPHPRFIVAGVDSREPIDHVLFSKSKPSFHARRTLSRYFTISLEPNFP